MCLFYSNTTNVKVKPDLCYMYRHRARYSNTTNVKVKPFLSRLKFSAKVNSNTTNVKVKPCADELIHNVGEKFKYNQC